MDGRYIDTVYEWGDIYFRYHTLKRVTLNDNF